MPNEFEDVLVCEYNGAYGKTGSVELQTVETATINRSKTRTAVTTMRRVRAPAGFQSGAEQVSIELTYVPEKLDAEVDWPAVWKNDEVFLFVAEHGLEGRREQFPSCMVSDINDTYNAQGEARKTVSIVPLESVYEPAAA